MNNFLEDLAARCPPETPFQFLRFIWFGDFACSSGEHYFPGNIIPFEKILKMVNKEHSDDLVENLACWAIRDKVPKTPSLTGWKDLCGAFYNLIKEDYLLDPIRYSPDYPKLFTSVNEAEYLNVITHHTNCGGAMRSSSLAYGGGTLHDLLTLVAMTHLYPESLAGAYALYEAVKILKKGGSIEDMWQAAIQAARQGEEQARELIEEWKGELVERGWMVAWMENVYSHRDARYGITDWYGEGISTRFVVSAALQIATEAVPLGPANALRHVVEQGIEIGGDPDTLGSMGMALIGAHFGEALHEEIDRVIKELIPPERFDIPDFLRYFN
jgi:hypothetical protein